MRISRQLIFHLHLSTGARMNSSATKTHSCVAELFAVEIPADRMRSFNLYIYSGGGDDGEAGVAARGVEINDVDFRNAVRACVRTHPIYKSNPNIYYFYYIMIIVRRISLLLPLLKSSENLFSSILFTFGNTLHSRNRFEWIFNWKQHKLYRSQPVWVDFNEKFRNKDQK